MKQLVCIIQGYTNLNSLGLHKLNLVKGKTVISFVNLTKVIIVIV